MIITLQLKPHVNQSAPSDLMEAPSDPRYCSSFYLGLQLPIISIHYIFIDFFIY